MKKAAILAAAVLALSCGASFSAEDSKPSEIGQVVDKILDPLSGVFSPYHRLDPIVVTPTRYEDPSLEVSSNIYVMDEETINESWGRYVPDVLRPASGVVVSDLLGNGKFIRVDMRGFGDTSQSNVLVLIDGRRVNQIDLSGADLVQVDKGSIERIELVRGPQSVLYGDNATAGVINIITKHGSAEKTGFEFDYGVGTNRYSSYRGQTSGGTKFLKYYAMASTSFNGGHRINSFLETKDYAANMNLKPVDHFELKFTGAHHEDWYGLPGAVLPENINTDGRYGSKSPNDRAKTEDYYYMFTPEFKTEFALGELLFNTDILWRNRRNTAVMLSSWGDYITTHHIRTFGVLPKCAFTADLFNIKNRLLVGFDYYGSDDEINSGFFSAPDTMVITKKSGGLYISDTVEFPANLILNTGFRSEWAYYKFDQQAVVKGINSKWPREYACEAGLTYKYNDRSSVYGKYSRSFRFPTTEEWYSSMYVDWFSGSVAGGLNLDLKPQVANNYEIGIKENSSKYLNIAADYYIMDTKNELYYDSTTNRNVVHHHTMHHGLEAEVSGNLFDCFKPFFNYSYQKAFFIGEAHAGNEIPLVPRHKFSTGIKYTYKDCVSVIYGIDYVGPRYFANDLQNNMPKLKSSAIHNIRFSYYKHGFEVYGVINNIFDTEYTEYGALDWSLTRPGYYPSPRMNASMGVKVSF